MNSKEWNESTIRLKEHEGLPTTHGLVINLEPGTDAALIAEHIKKSEAESSATGRLRALPSEAAARRMAQSQINDLPIGDETGVIKHRAMFIVDAFWVAGITKEFPLVIRGAHDIHIDTETRGYHYWTTVCRDGTLVIRWEEKRTGRRARFSRTWGNWLTILDELSVHEHAKETL